MSSAENGAAASAGNKFMAPRYHLLLPHKEKFSPANAGAVCPPSPKQWLAQSARAALPDSSVRFNFFLKYVLLPIAQSLYCALEKSYPRKAP